MIDVRALFHAIESHALASGLFARVNMHEPANPPGSGLSAAVWLDRIDPLTSSGLAATSGRLTFNVRIYSPIGEPQDAIDPEMLTATATLLDAYSGDFDLGVTGVRCVDLLGQSGVALSAQAGYLQQVSMTYRVMTITLPILVNDIWTQVA